MKVMVSKTMCRELNKYAQTQPIFNQYEFQFDELSRRLYEWNVNMDSYKYENDYQVDKGLFKFIRVVYPDDYYAMPRYLTTNDLERCFQHSDGTYQSFMNEVMREVEI